MPPGPGMLDAMERARLQAEIEKMTPTEKAVAEKVYDEMFELRTNSVHLFVLSLLSSVMIGGSMKSLTVTLLLICLSILSPFIHKYFKRKSILNKLTAEEQEILIRAFPKDFKQYQR